MTPSGIEPATFRFVAQHLNHCATTVPQRLDGPGLNPSGDEIFRLSRLALGPTQPPVQWVFPGGKVWPGRAADHSPPSGAAVMEE